MRNILRYRMIPKHKNICYNSTKTTKIQHLANIITVPESYLLSRSFSMYSNFGVRTPFEVMTAFRIKDMTSNLTNVFIVFNHLHKSKISLVKYIN